MEPTRAFFGNLTSSKLTVRSLLLLGGDKDDQAYNPVKEHSNFWAAFFVHTRSHSFP